jgi:hypothetical protein
METNDQPNRGRPSYYSAEIAETICGRLVDGESLRAICADPAMPARATVFRWLARNQEFRRSLRRSRRYSSCSPCWWSLPLKSGGAARKNGAGRPPAAQASS